MPIWDEVLKEIENQLQKEPLAVIKQKYLNQLLKNRSGIAYYSSWFQKLGIGGVNINDSDKNSFVSVVCKMNQDKELDLMLHTPGGEVAAMSKIFSVKTVAENIKDCHIAGLCRANIITCYCNKNWVYGPDISKFGIGKFVT